MFSEQFFDLLLNLDENWKVDRVYVNSKIEEVDIFVSYCGSYADDPDTLDSYKLYDHAPSRRWRHLDTMQYKTYINCSVPRVKNEEGKIKTIQTPWANGYERHTFMFERLAIDILKATKNQTKTSELLRCGFNVINRIVSNSVKRGLERRPSTFRFSHLSLDEKSFKKGHKYVTVLSEPLSGTVIDISENRDYNATVEVFAKTFNRECIKDVETVCMDMWKPYLKATKYLLPKAEIVHDRFHLVKYLNDAVDKVRRREVKVHDELKKTKYIFLKNPENQTEQQRIKFEAISDANYEVSRAWRIKENFRDIFGCDNTSDAFHLIMRWLNHATSSNIKEIIKVADMFKNHFKGIVNAMVNSFSNAMAERLNGKIQEIKSCGRGYRKFENFRNAILFFHGGLSLYPLK